MNAPLASQHHCHMAHYAQLSVVRRSSGPEINGFALCAFGIEMICSCVNYFGFVESFLSCNFMGKPRLTHGSVLGGKVSIQKEVSCAMPTTTQEQVAYRLEEQVNGSNQH